MATTVDVFMMGLLFELVKGRRGWKSQMKCGFDSRSSLFELEQKSMIDL
jgi:hypothetical protein